MHWPRLELERMQRLNRYRTLALAAGIDFTSNDYLGLSAHPALREAAMAALTKQGVAGSGGSRLLRGHHVAHAELEEFAASFFGAGKTLYFSSGFLANVALFTALPEQKDAVVYDELIHASVRQGMHASRSARFKARHNDPESFETEIKRARAAGASRVFIAVESVYSMDGDLAPLKDLNDIARTNEATLIIDEAHATGVFGARGRGLTETLPHDDQTIVLHTCGKALGVAGALICASAETIDYLINKARPFIYSTAPPPFLASMVLRALQLVNEEPWRRQRVLELAPLAHRELNGGSAFSGSQIVPVILGTDERALAVADALQKGGFDVRAVRPPTVPEGTSRLRISIHAAHSEDDIASLGKALRAATASA